MANYKPMAARGAAVQKPLIGVRPGLASITPPSSPIRPRMPSTQPPKPRTLQPNVAQRQLTHCRIKGCTTPAVLPTAKARDPRIKQHSAQPQRIASAKIAEPTAIPSKAVHLRSATFRSRVVQRQGTSGFTPTMIVKPDQYVVTQVNSGLGGMFGHSELFLEHWIGDENRVGATKIHLQTRGEPRIVIKEITGNIDTTPPRVKSHKSYTVTKEQYEKILKAALRVQRKMKKKRIIYAEIFPDRNDKWKTVKKEWGVEMSCKSFTDALLMEVQLRTGYGGMFFNHPGDL